MKYMFYLNDKLEGSVTFDGEDVVPDFWDPSMQLDMIQLIKDREPKNIKELTLNGFSYWDIFEEGKERNREIL